MQKTLTKFDVLLINHSDLVGEILHHGSFFELPSVGTVVFFEQFGVLFELIFINFFDFFDEVLAKLIDIFHLS